jgi:hypothetical protein
MARKPRDFDAELQALMERTRKVKTQKTAQLGELVLRIPMKSPGQSEMMSPGITT